MSTQALDQLSGIFTKLAMRVGIAVLMGGIPILVGVYTVVSFVVDKSLLNLNATLDVMNHRIDDIPTNIQKLVDAKFDGLEAKLRLEFVNTRELVRKASIDNKNFATSVWYLRDGQESLEINFPTVINGPSVSEILTNPQFATFSRKLALDKKIHAGDILFAVAPTNDAFAGQAAAGKSLAELVITKNSDAAALRSIVKNFPQCATFVSLGPRSVYLQPKANVIYTDQGIICPLERP